MSEEPNSGYHPLTWEAVRLTVIIGGKGKTDQERMDYARARINDSLGNTLAGLDDVEAVEILRDDEPTEAETIQAACQKAIRDLEAICKPVLIANDLRSAIGWPKKQEKPNAVKI